MKLLTKCLVIVMVLSAGMCFAEEKPAGESESGPQVITGTIQHVSYEGGFYSIKSDEGEDYKPLRLSLPFQREGLRVKAIVQPVEKDLLFQPWGMPVKILSIEKMR